MSACTLQEWFEKRQERDFSLEDKQERGGPHLMTLFCGRDKTPRTSIRVLGEKQLIWPWLATSRQL